MLLSIVIYEKRNIIFYTTNLKLTKKYTLINVFCNRIFRYYQFLPIFWKWLNFHKSWLIFLEKYSLELYRFQSWKTSNTSINIVIFFKNSFFYVVIFEIFLPILKIGISRVVETILRY